MTTQNQKPEQGKRIEITEGDLPPTEVDVRPADIVDRSEPIVLNESDFPTEVTPDRLVVTEEEIAEPPTWPAEDNPGRVVLSEGDLDDAPAKGQNAGRIVLEKTDFDAPNEGRLGDAEMEAKEKFLDFMEAFLPEEADDEGDRSRKYSIEAKDQLIPVDTVEFYDTESIQGEHPDPNRRTKSIYMVGANGSNFQVCYDDALGFASVVDGQYEEIDPQVALNTVDILTRIDQQGNMEPVEHTTS